MKSRKEIRKFLCRASNTDMRLKKLREGKQKSDLMEFPIGNTYLGLLKEQCQSAHVKKTKNSCFHWLTPPVS